MSAFFGGKNLSVIKMHVETVKKNESENVELDYLMVAPTCFGPPGPSSGSLC